MLSLLFGATVYTFSLILAVFLFGLGIGSSLGSALARSIERPRLALGWCQMLLCAAIAWAAYMLTQSLPYWPINPSISASPWFNFQLDLVRASGSSCRRRFSGARAFRSRSRRSRSKGQDPGAPGRRRLRRQHGRRDRRLADGSSPAGHAGSAPSTRSRCSSSCPACRRCSCSSRCPTQRERASRAPRSPARCRSWSRPSCAALLRAQRARAAGLLVAYGRYAATRASAGHRHHLHGRRAGTPRSRSRGCRTASSTITTPARSRPRASRRTCACSACSAT